MFREHSDIKGVIVFLLLFSEPAFAEQGAARCPLYGDDFAGTSSIGCNDPDNLECTYLAGLAEVDIPPTFACWLASDTPITVLGKETRADLLEGQKEGRWSWQGKEIATIKVERPPKGVTLFTRHTTWDESRGTFKCQPGTVAIVSIWTLEEAYKNAEKRCARYVEQGERCEEIQAIIKRYKLK